MTDDFNTQSTSSWKAGAGTGQGIAFSTWVSIKNISKKLTERSGIYYTEFVLCKVVAV